MLVSFRHVLLFSGVILYISTFCQSRDRIRPSMKFDRVSLMDGPRGHGKRSSERREGTQEDNSIDHIDTKLLTEVQCGPYPQVVKVYPEDPSWVHKPMYIMLHRCGGACVQAFTHTCQPLERKSIRLVVDTSHDNANSNVLATVTNHTKCTCACKTFPLTCGPNKSWNGNICRCVCVKKLACGDNELWDPDKCICSRR